MFKVKERIRKLLAQAADQEGTPEGEVFYRKAFELMARYGLEQSDVPSDPHSKRTTSAEYHFDGSYTDLQARLLLTIANALHCVGVQDVVHRSTRVSAVKVFGLTSHLERVDMLYSILNLNMIAGAYGIVGRKGIRRARRSYMLGFCLAVGQRLADAERKVASEHQPRTLALIDDRTKAKEALDAYLSEQGMRVFTRKSRSELDPAAYGAGAAAGARSDIGQARVSSRRAIAG
ncbi:DUF2786 domain-containing protein [Corynebacterium epidermidicanis]|uniref:Putative DUF2786 family protein n=1 Tax=Corynebacterium epidermidicanis TaxID=1050174 RepID=A0A0G3GP25_9CORY|nr:DUF2786 domain-containing protein [Corynebacterium epidermidicanis]AKK02305.1 putative DUF2786 family protein [Corynebacterium epidermidicanis]